MTDSKETCEMLPCPLCGRQPDYQHFNISQNMRGRIICTCGLGLTQGRNDTEDGTILKWNTRSDHAVQAANERKAEQAIAATVCVGTCHYNPDDAGFTWWDENDVEHYEEYSASDECDSASCDKCGYSMMVGEEGWFDGWDEITEWTEEDGSEHKGYVLKPKFKFCPKCGRQVK